jgi:hypothetical protein
VRVAASATAGRQAAIANLEAELQAAHGAIDEAPANLEPIAKGFAGYFRTGDLCRIDNLHAFPLTYPIGASPDGR